MANRYWVGGAGNWSSTTKWSTTSGGASGASVPTSVDDAIFDANSGGKFTATVDTAQSVNSITITPSAAVGVQQIALSARLTTNNLTTTGTAGNNRIWFRGNTYGIAQDFVVNGTVSISDCDFRDIYVIGTAAPISGTRIGDLRGIRGITASTPKTVYWNLVAGGAWTDNAWAASSGGGVSTDNFPLAQDTAVIENTGLNTSAAIATPSSGVPIAMSTVDASTRTLAMTLTLNTSTYYGNFKLGSGVALSGNTGSTFSGRNTQTITSAGKTFSCPITVDSYGGSVELVDALNIGANTLTVTNGTFDTKNYNVTAGSFSSVNSNVRTINLGSSTITLNQAQGWTFTTSTNATLNSGTSQINSTATNPGFAGGGLTYYNVSMTSTSVGQSDITGANTFNNLTITAPASAGLTQCTFAANQTVNGTLTCAGATAVRRIFVRSDTLGTTRTLTVNSLSAQDCDFRDITIAGTAAGSSPTRAGNCGGNTGITFPAAKTVYWALTGGGAWTSANVWATSIGGTGDTNNFPLAQDTAVFPTGYPTTGNSITLYVAMNHGGINTSAKTTETITLDNNGAAQTFYGDILFGSGTTLTGNPYTLAKRGTQTITSSGVTFNQNLTIDSFSGTVQLADALTLGSTRTLTLTSGTFDAVTYNVTTGAFNNTSATTATVLKMGSGTWTLSGTSTVWNTNTLTFYKGTANIVLSNTSTTARTFSAGTASYNKLTIGGTTGTSTTTINGNGAQFTELASTKTVAHTIDLGTAALTLGAWTVTGTAGNVVTVTGTAVLTIAGAAVSGVDYLALGTTTVSATSPGEFYAGANSTGTAAAPVYRTAKPADSTRYWVGGTGNWSDTARWSTSSGGGSGASVPRSHDDVVFDALSNATAYTATVNAVTGGIRTKALTVAGPLVGNLTLAGSAAIVGIHGNVTLPATGLTRTYTGALTLSGSGSATITTNGVSFAQDTVLNGIGSNWTLGSAFTMGTGNAFQLANGTLNTANYNCSFARFFVSLLSGAVTLNLGSSTITENSLGFAINGANPNFTLNAGTSTFNNTMTGGAVIQNSSPNTLTFHNYNFTGADPTSITITGTNIFNNLSFAGRTSAGVTPISIGANQTINGTLTLSAGTNATMRTFVRSDTIGTTRTLTCANFVGTDVDFRDITIAGAAAPVSGTRLGDCKGNGGITFDAAKTVYTSGGGLSSNWSTNIWAATNGGVAALTNFPLAQDTAIITSGTPSATGLLTVNANYNIGTIDMSARTSNTMTLATGGTTPTIYGNWINGTGTTLSGTGTLTFAGRGSQTITSAGKTFTQGFTINTPSGSVTLQDAFNSSNASAGTIALVFGTFNANGYSVTLSGASATAAMSGTSVRIMAVGSGTWTIAGSGNAWLASTSTNLTVTGTGTISLTSASAKTFAGGGISYSGITLNQGGAGTLTITGNNTFANISNTYKATGATTIAMGTTTQRVGNFTASGEAGRVLTVQGTSASSPATLVITGAAKPNVDYLTITGVRAYNLTDTWYAGTNSTNNGSLGWYFQSGTVATSTVYYGAVNVTVLYYGGTPVNSMYYGSVKVF